MNTEDHQNAALQPARPSPYGRPFKHRVYFWVLILATCSYVGAFFGGHYGATRNLVVYTGPRSAVGMQLPSSGELAAAMWGAIPALVLGALLGIVARLSKVRMDLSPVKSGATIGFISGGITGLIGGITHTWVNGTITGAIAAILFGLLGIFVADKEP